MECQPLPTIGDPIQNLLDGDCFIRVIQLMFALGALRLRAVHGIGRFFVGVCWDVPLPLLFDDASFKR